MRLLGAGRCVLLLLQLLTTLPSGSAQHAAPRDDELIVSTTSGVVHGTFDPELPNVRQFLGIPFAKPPVGDLRWAAPEAISQEEEEITATELPPSCPQTYSTGASVYHWDVLEFNLQGLNQTGAISEDCLFLSVWTPTQQNVETATTKGQLDAGLPVLVYIYGGAFAGGGIDVPYQIPTQWINRSPNHIVVSLNYRVNIFGFPSAQGLEDQNVGLLDQRLAVEWVKANIAQFQGDPNRITLWGQSAGAASVDMYGYAYPDDPIVAGAIMDSGVAGLLEGISVADSGGSNFSYVASQVGCPDLADQPEQQLACMRTIDFQTISDFVGHYSGSPGISFVPTPDEKVVFSNYTDRALAGKQASIPAIIGVNTDEGTALAAYNADGPDPAAAHQATLSAFACPATNSIKNRQQMGLLTYRYQYAGNFTNVSPRPWMGAYHSAELPMLFGTHPNFRGLSTDLEYGTSYAMQEAWVAFASDPVNGLAAQDWHAYQTLGSSDVREFGADVAAQSIDVAALEAECNNL